MAQPIPADYHAHVLDGVELNGDHVVLRYGGKIFGGIVAGLLPDPAVLAAIKPGARVVVRYHTAETGEAGQIAHMLIDHPTEPGWAELYADWE